MIRIGTRVLFLAVMLAGCEDKGGAPSTGAVSAAPTVKAAADPGTAPSPGTGATTAAAKVFDCGGKDQKPCPMQGWMKRVMAPASAGDDGAALAKALTYVAEHAPPGYPDWATMARAGAAKAKAGDVDGAKGSCKQCHDAYKEGYKTTMRDRPF
jgi:hypothetical protein